MKLLLIAICLSVLAFVSHADERQNSFHQNVQNLLKSRQQHGLQYHHSASDLNEHYKYPSQAEPGAANSLPNSRDRWIGVKMSAKLYGPGKKHIRLLGENQQQNNKGNEINKESYPGSESTETISNSRKSPTCSCTKFLSIFNDARTITSMRRVNERNLQASGFIMQDDDIGYTEPGANLINSGAENRNAETITTVAGLLRDREDIDVNSILNYAKCLHCRNLTLTSHSKYRSIDGFGNNLKNPFWGTSGTPFSRFGAKAYEDGIHSIRKSVMGNDLPSPRKIVTKVLLQAQKANPPTQTPNTLINMLVLYLTHDMAFQAPIEGSYDNENIRCCSNRNKNVLAPEFSHSACLPVTVPENDPFYRKANVKCLNMVRAQQSSSPCTLQNGEILNKATSYIDHSIVYGSEDLDTRKIRTFSSGKLRIPSNKVLPTDRFGNYLQSSLRLAVAPIGAVWPSIFARNHNKLAEGLAAVNPQWDDETLFQEARRINIAIFHSGIFSGRIIETIFKKRINETYKENFDASTSLEFSTAYRIGHFYLQPEMLLIDETGTTEKVPHSETLGRLDLVENYFEATVRGLLQQPVNYLNYSEEIFNRFAKNKDGMGLDLLSIDIQRGRDHGLPTFLDARRKSGFKADFKTFDDLTEIFPQHNVELLKSVYEDVEDIDLYVGAMLETFSSLDEVLVGETLGYVIGHQYQRSVGGDVYFYTHKVNPHPFTDSQIHAIDSFTFNHLICQNTNVEFVPKNWLIVESPTNPRVACRDYTRFDFQPFAMT
ncbi:CLUMA_CG020666, isoform A [Clunio marinus]|uniref:CLUMA_CG020666, isoform A n=1 Tax=Clunio marinus TaxID=568069 RepID=A0A1J1J5N1_9DIPT|nr:CLUMA_CG020666, isoform A [Clunio marinus]